MPYHRSEEHTSELQSHSHLVCRLLLEKKKKKYRTEVDKRRSSDDRRPRLLLIRYVMSPAVTPCPHLGPIFAIPILILFFFLNKRAPPEINPLPLHAPLPT